MRISLALKVRGDEIHGSENTCSVRHVYLHENPPSPNKVECPGLYCVNEMNVKADNGLFMLVSGNRH